MTSIDHHLTEAEKLTARGFEENDGTWALVYQQAAQTHATIALTMATAAKTNQELAAELETVRAELEAERRKNRDAALSMRNRAAATAVTAVWQMPAHGWAELNKAMRSVYALPLDTDRTPGAPTIHDDAVHGRSKLAATHGATTCGLPAGDVGRTSDNPDGVTCPWCRDLL